VRCAAGRTVALALAVVAALHLTATGVAQVAADPPRGAFRVVLFGDFNGPYGALDYPPAVARTVAAIAGTWRPDLVLLPGDLVAGQSRTLPDDRFAEMWKAFDAVVAAPLRAAGIPYAAALGNHDASKLRSADGGYAFARERDAAAAYWGRPEHRTGLDEVVDDDGAPFAWSFRQGPLFVALVDASGPVLNDDERDRLDAALSSPVARAAALRWVVGHLPLVGIAEGRDREGEVLWRAEDLRDRWRAAGVDSYVSGHQAAFYAGTWGGLELLFTGGVGARPLRGSGRPARSAVTVVDVDLEPVRVRIVAFDPGTLQILPAAAWPERLDAFGGTLVRSERLAPAGGTTAP
jgi:hypothetical protein